MAHQNDKNTQGGPQGRPPLMGAPNRWQPLVTTLIFLAIVAYAFRGISTMRSSGSVDPLPTNDFVVAVKEDRVKSVVYKTSDGSLTGTYWPSRGDVDNVAKARQFKSYYVGSDSLQDLMADHPDVVFEIDTASSEVWELLLTAVVPTLILAGVMFHFTNRIQGQNNSAMNFGKADKARTSEETRPKTKFSDVAGIDEAVEELQEIKDFLSDPDRYLRMGAKIPRGVLLVGPPGTGKTLLAKAVAGEAGVPFFSISGSDFVEMFVGVGASRVRSLFKQAKEESPSIVFIDEIDAVGRQRGAGLGGGHDEREQTLNQLLVEMDGFEDNQAVILIAATNRPDILDPALLRPGRFDRRVTVDRPDVRGREQILRVHSTSKPLDSGVDFERIARLTPGFSGADLANLMNEAALLAARRGKTKISPSEVEEAMERVMAGPERKSRVITEGERRVIAYHESGHALVGHVLENSDPVHKISIVARGGALGYTMQVPEEDHFLETRDGMLDQIAVLLAGRTAEELFCDDITTGASNDLERATKLAREMVTRYGMSEEMGTQVFGEAQHEVFLGRDYASRQDYSAETSKRIDDEVERIMREAHNRACEVLEARRDQMDLMASVLLANETVEGEAVEALLEGRWDEFLEANPDAMRGSGDSDEAIDEQALLEESRAAAAAAVAAEAHDDMPDAVAAAKVAPPRPEGLK